MKKLRAFQVREYEDFQSLFCAETSRQLTQTRRDIGPDTLPFSIFITFFIFKLLPQNLTVF